MVSAGRAPKPAFSRETVIDRGVRSCEARTQSDREEVSPRGEASQGAAMGRVCRLFRIALDSGGSRLVDVAIEQSVGDWDVAGDQYDFQWEFKADAGAGGEAGGGHGVTAQHVG